MNGAAVGSQLETRKLVSRLSIASVALLMVAHADASSAQSPNWSEREAPFWGDLHLHTKLSVDANREGNVALGPDQAYRFAQGERVTPTSGKTVQLRRPLDFLAVTDHAENMGVFDSLRRNDEALLATERGKRLAAEFKAAVNASDEAGRSVVEFGKQLWLPDSTVIDTAYRRHVWRNVVAAAEKHNQPGIFTAFAGFEWSSSLTMRANLHRVVIFGDGPARTEQVIPFSLHDSERPEELWRYLAEYEAKARGRVLAIPHNSNTSLGLMFARRDSAGKAIDREYAVTRSRWEPLVEITQVKGTSETHPELSPDDEFADFEVWSGARAGSGTLARLRAEYVRPALATGMALQMELGTNPFKVGFVGGTDAHTSLAAVDEDVFMGKFPHTEPDPKRIERQVTSFDPQKLGKRAWELSASGYTAVWATENTREALFDAMKRKEVYASTGPRITVRFFGGWDYQEMDAYRPDLAKIGYSGGVPMGGDLASAPDGKAPRFLIRAVKDPLGANLDRVQVVKGWLDGSGETHEQIYNVTLSDGRQEGPDGKAPPVGSTVNVADASYTNTIGDPELAVVWGDPGFNPKELSFYYLRVLEIPTPRWTAYDAKYFKLKDLPEEIPMVTQERAYTSPIWYTP